ncbi:DMT family transporter [Cognatishimia sp.]|uniref:DMT family transporter n=1 Tax=Cognatishimia sp. TaxID=2211648 RepID=UPI003511094F
MINLRAMIFMIVGMATFAGGDAMVKLSASATPTGLVMMTMGLAGALVFFTACRISKTRIWSPLFFHPVIFIRNIFEAAAAYFLFQALALVDLSKVAAVLQAIPLLLTLMAAVFLKERVGPRRWIAVGVGLLGVMIIIRPTTEGIDGTEFLAVLGTISLALRDLTSRLAPPEASTPLLSFYAFSTLVPMGAILNYSSGDVWAIDPSTYGPLALMILFSVTGYYCVTMAMRLGDVSAVSPLRYFRLPCTAALGYLLFDEIPDMYTIAGAILVVGSGLFVMLREAQLGRAKS